MGDLSTHGNGFLPIDILNLTYCSIIVRSTESLTFTILLVQLGQMSRVRVQVADKLVCLVNFSQNEKFLV